MNIKRVIDKNYKLIWYIIAIIVFALFVIKISNFYYEQSEEKKKLEVSQGVSSNEDEIVQFTEKDYTTKSDSIELTMSSFVNYCNKRDLENAYKMLTDECKEAMYPTVEYFEKNYIDIVYKINRDYDLTKWSTDGDMITYLVKLYGNILATGKVDEYTEEYITFVKDDNGKYKLNINNYIYGEDRNIQKTSSNITVKLSHVDVYDEYEEAKITVTNNTSKKICLTGNKYNKNIYLKSLAGTGYSPLNSEFETQVIVMEPNTSKTFNVTFNKEYSASNKAVYLVLSDIILDYEEYLASSDQSNYTNRTSIKMNYQK